MPSVKIARQTKLSPEDTFKRISALLSNDKDLKKIDRDYKADFNESTLSGTATGSMFKAKMNVTKDAGGSKLEIVVDLPMALMLAKGMVEKTLTKKVEEALA